jgi:hypothetical protein
MMLQFNGQNNGDLCAAAGVMKKLGWNSKRQLMEARKELEHYGLIRVTRQGGRTKTPTLYAVTFINIHYCKGKHHHSTTETPTLDWRQDREKWTNPYSTNGLERLRKRRSKNSFTGSA